MSLENQLDDFSSIPNSALDNITDKKPNAFGSKEISEDEIISTGNRATGDSTTGQNEQSQTQTEKKTTSTKLGNLIGGELAIRLLDMAIPALLVVSIHYIGYSINKESLKLNKDDKNVLTPVLTDALNAIEIDLNNPYYNLLFVMAFVYGTKVVEQIPEIKKRPKKEKLQQTRISQEEFADNIRTPISKSDNATISDLVEAPPETKFNDAMKLLCKEIVREGRRKSERGARLLLMRDELWKVNELRQSFGLRPYPEGISINKYGEVIEDLNL